MMILKIVFSLLMTFAGGAKIMGVKALADQFEEFGLPKFFLYLVGALELSAAIGVQIHVLSFYAASGSVLLMLGAVFNHLKIKHPFQQALPSIVVLCLSALIAFGSWEQWKDIFTLLGV